MSVTTKAVKPLVVGAPRSGFSLLISVCNVIMNYYKEQQRTSLKKAYRDGMIQLGSIYITDTYLRAFDKLGISDDAVFNGEFHLLVGGPKWLDAGDPTKACVRKYVGIKGQGDFLFVVKHPREMLEYHPVLHSHEHPRLWCEVPYYNSFTKMASVRNPVGIINSACFSLNAMASEYIQRFIPNPDDTGDIRQRHAAFKLTDTTFMRGLVKYLTNYFDEFLPVQDQYFILKWEDLISEPEKSIQRVGRELGYDIPRYVAEELWLPMDHKNLMEHHKHNYRKGKGIVGDWKNSLVNEHLEIFKEMGFDHYLKELGYAPMTYINEAEYSPYQKLIARYLKRGEIFQNTGDADLFGMAYNKTNLDTSEMSFKSFAPQQWTHVERTTVKDDSVVEYISNEVEKAYAHFHEIYKAFSPAKWRGTKDVVALVAELKRLNSECQFQDPSREFVRFFHTIDSYVQHPDKR